MSGGGLDREALARIRLVQGDITQQAVDAIVNAANRSLRGGGGVDGAIHRAAGPGLLEECIRRHPEGCPTGEARLTGGHGLPARWVVHAVGPVWRGGARGEAEALASCHRMAVALAAEAGARTIAFPAISTGAYRYPPELAAPVALGAIAEALAAHPQIEEARVVLFTSDLLRVFEEALAALRAEAEDRSS